jgi:hypothetical protein
MYSESRQNASWGSKRCLISREQGLPPGPILAAHPRRLFGELPIAEMAKRGWINVPDIRAMKNVETELMRFFGANSLKDIEILPHAAKKTGVSSDPTPPQLAGLYQVKKTASEMLVMSLFRGHRCC